jgi:hypothetical protein
MDAPGMGLVLSAGPGLRYVWESRYGTILIEVAGDEVLVNGQRVERHAHPAMPAAESSASLGQNSLHFGFKTFQDAPLTLYLPPGR